MTDYFADPVNGNNADSGKTWPTAKLTLAALKGIATIAAGDHLYAGPGTYRELLSLGAGGRTIRSTGTVTMTTGSKVVTGAGATNWSPGVHVGDRILVPWLASGSDGDCTAGGTMTSATGLFEAAITGFGINIWSGANGGSYVVTFGAGNSLTLTDPNALGWPAAAGGYNFRVPSNEGSYEIASIESDTQVTLTRKWSGPTYTTRSYEIYRPVYLTADNTGAHTDGVGGIVRITGSTGDLAANLNKCIYADGKSYWVIQGFQVDTTVFYNIHIKDSTHITIEDIVSLNPGEDHMYFEDDNTNITVRRCALFGGQDARGLFIHNVLPVRTASFHAENIEAHCDTPFQIDDMSSVTIKNCVGGMSGDYFVETVQPGLLGQSVFVHDCEIHYCATAGLEANANGQIIAHLNNYWANTARFNANVGEAGLTNYAYMHLPETPLLVDGHRYPIRFYPPSEWWMPRALLGLYGANQGIYGVDAPTTIAKRSYGPHLDQYIARDAITIYGGQESSTAHIDARTTQFRAAISGVPVTITVQVYLEAAYAGTAPKLVVHQSGNTDAEDTATGTTGAWEQLSVAYTPNAQPLVLWIELVSDNTAAIGGQSVVWQELDGGPA